MLVTIDVPEGMKVTEETFQRLTAAEGEGRVELVNGRLGIVARYTNQDGARDTGLVSVLLAELSDGAA